MVNGPSLEEKVKQIQRLENEVKNTKEKLMDLSWGIMVLARSRRGSKEVGLDTLNIKVSINHFIEKGFLINQMSRSEGEFKSIEVWEPS